MMHNDSLPALDTNICGELDIKVTDLSMVFDDGTTCNHVLDKISFSVNKGELICIVGPTGCGKSTLLRILLGLQKPTNGLHFLNPERRKEGIAYVQQSSLLLPWRTALQNATLGLELKGWLNPSSIRRTKSELKKMNLDKFDKHLPHQLSGGMRQKVDILRALQSEPALLFCDEPFSAMDFDSRLEMNTQFRYLTKARDVTTLFVTHNIEEAIFLGDRVIVFTKRPGKILNIHVPQLSIGREDAVKCRKSPEFEPLFTRIWEELS